MFDFPIKIAVLHKIDQVIYVAITPLLVVHNKELYLKNFIDLGINDLNKPVYVEINQRSDFNKWLKNFSLNHECKVKIESFNNPRLLKLCYHLLCAVRVESNKGKSGK